MAALATVAQFEYVNQVTLTGDTSGVQFLLEASSAAVRRYTGQQFHRVTDDTVTVRPNVKGAFILPERPVTAVTAVEYQGVEVSAEWDADGRIVPGLSGLDPWSNNVTPGWTWPALDVTYDHGYETADMPPDVIFVVCSAAGRVVDNATGHRSEAAADYSVVYAIPGDGHALGISLSRPERDLLEPFRRSASSFRVSQ